MRSPEEFAHTVDEPVGDSAGDECARPRVEVVADDFDLPIAGNKDHVRTIICETPEFASSPFCVRGPDE